MPEIKTWYNDATTNFQTFRDRDDEPKTVASELKRLDNRRANLLREFYYKVADALPQLAEELEFADLDLGGDGGPLIEQHLAVCEMMEAFKRVELGKHL